MKIKLFFFHSTKNIKLTTNVPQKLMGINKMKKNVGKVFTFCFLNLNSKYLPNLKEP